MSRRIPFQFDADGQLWWITKRHRRHVIGHCYWTGRKMRPLPLKLQKLVPKPMAKPLRPERVDYVARVEERRDKRAFGRYEALNQDNIP